MNVHRLASIAVLAVLLAACASARTQTVAAYAGAPLPRPDRIIVYDFAVSPEEVSLDQGIGARIKREVEDKSPGAAELEAARATQTALAAALARDLQSYGLIAELTQREPDCPQGRASRFRARSSALIKAIAHGGC